MDTQSMELDFEMDAFSEFLSTYPAYKDTMIIDSLRREEYPHLDEKGQACLDYTGVGLFSSSQKRSEFNGGTGIGLSHISSNLATHAMYTEESSTESYFRKRILCYLNLSEDDYYIVFTANAFSAFKLLGASYPFHEAPNLLLAYDHRCENADAITECPLACIQSVALSLPWCKIDSDDLKKKLRCKKKVGAQKVGMNKGLFALPYSSRVTGCRSSSWWIPQAQQNGWHVLLDVTSVDAKMLDSLGLSIFLPDFVICSFYNVFGEDPTGLGCLAIKKSVLRTLGDSSRARAIGMVKIVNKQASSLIPSDSTVSVNEHRTAHTNDSRLQSPTGDDLLGSSKHSPSQPEWSADLLAIDKSLFYQSDGNDTPGSEVVLHEDRGEVHGAKNGKGSSCANPSRLLTCEREKEPLHVDVDLPILDGVLNDREITSARANSSQIHSDHRSTSFSTWMADQLMPTGSFRSISTREWNERDFNFPTYNNFLQDAIGAPASWQSRVSQIQQIGPSYSYSSHSMRTNGLSIQHMPPEPSTSRKLKGLFYGDSAPKRSADHMSLRRLFKHETKAGVVAHLQRAGQVHSGEILTVHDWMTFYASKAKVWNSNSSNTSSSATSSRRFGEEYWLEGDARLMKAGANMQNRIACRGLDHADMLGYKRIAVRLRSLADWLISSLSRLQHPPPKCFKLVKLCSRMSFASTVAFTLLDSSGNAFDVKRVQLLADRNNISVRTGVIEGTLSTDSLERGQHQEEFMLRCVELPGKCHVKEDTVQTLQLPVLYVSLGFLNNFSDVYKLWRFCCRFLDPQFVDQELWHYQALNQETIEI